VTTGGVTQDGDMVRADDDFPLGRWVLAEPGETVTDDDIVRRRIEPQQPSDSEPETMEMRLAKMTQWNLELEALVAEADRGGEQVNAELQQLREQVATLTRERDRLQSWLQQHHTTGQQSAIKKLERWLKPVVKVVADHPDHSSILAVSVLEFLPQIASRLIEE
jgi:soluble cytochrome b562